MLAVVFFALSASELVFRTAVACAAHHKSSTPISQQKAKPLGISQGSVRTTYVQSLLKVLFLLEDYSSEKNMNTTDHLSAPANPSESNMVEQFTLIDLLLVIVENLRLLVIGPIVVGLIVFVTTSIWAKTYESTAILKAEQITASLMNSAAVLDPIASSLGYTLQMPQDDARNRLKDQVQARFNAKDKLITLTAQAQSPQAAQALGLAVLQQTFVQSQPRNTEKSRLEKQMEQAKVREKEASEAAKLLSKKMDSIGGAAATEVAQGYAQMMRVVQDSQAVQTTIEQQLIGLDASAIVQDPTLPTKHTEPRRGLVTVLAVQTAGFVLLLWVFMRHSFKNSGKKKQSAEKTKEIKMAWRKAIGLKREV